MYHRKISENYSMDMSLFRKYCNYRRLTFLNIDIDYLYDKTCDHSPSFSFMFVVFGIIILEFNVYNVNHCSY